MSLAEFDTVTDKLRGATEYIYLHVMGEPLTHPDVAKMIKLASDKGFHVAVTTNGTLLGKRGEELVEAGVYKVNISVHSFEEGTREEYLSYLMMVNELEYYDEIPCGDLFEGKNARERIVIFSLPCRML